MQPNNIDMRKKIKHVGIIFNLLLQLTCVCFFFSFWEKLNGTYGSINTINNTSKSKIMTSTKHSYSLTCCRNSIHQFDFCKTPTNFQDSYLIETDTIHGQYSYAMHYLI